VNEELLKLVKKLSHYGLSEKVLVKIFNDWEIEHCGARLENLGRAKYFDVIKFPCFAERKEEQIIRLRDVLKFLFPRDYQCYYTDKTEESDIKRSNPYEAFFPLPEVDTDEESSDYDSDNDNDEKSFFEDLSKLKVGPREIPGWILKDVSIKAGNCFYESVVDQLALINHNFMNEEALISGDTLPEDLLRLRISRFQGREFRDREWADYHEIISLARRLYVIVAVVDTRHPENGFIYHYINSNGNADFTRITDTLPNRPIVRLAYTGDHYLSVMMTSGELVRGILQSSYFFERMYDRYVMEHRHNDPYIQKKYDERFNWIFRK
jgi:hypothetical protein